MTLIGPCRLSFGRIFIVFVSATCLVIASYSVWFQASDHSIRIVSEDERSFYPLTETRPFDANVSTEVETLQVDEAKYMTPVYLQVTSVSNQCAKVGESRRLRSFQSPRLESQTENVSGTFQIIDNSKIWIYSTHFEMTKDGSHYIRGFGISQRGKYPRIYCYVNELIYEGKISSFLDSHPMYTSYISIYFLCRLSQGCRPDFVSVSLSNNKTDEPTNKFSVLYPQPRKYNITVCHPALFGPYRDVYRIIQSIEINRVLGAEHIFIYNLSVSNEIEIVLKQYEKDGVLTVFPWPLPAESNAWYYAQHTAINDCVYRNRNLSAYVAIVDVDEFIIPAKAKSWPDMIQQINNEYYGNNGENKPVMGSMGFESSPFQAQLAHNMWKQIMKNFSFTEEEENIITKYSLFPMLSFERREPPFPFPKKSKSIVLPELVCSVGIHHVHDHQGPAIQYLVSNNVAIVNHYKSRIGSRATKLDLNILRLKDNFFPRLKLAIDRFAKILV